MANDKLKIQLEVKDIDLVKELIELLQSHYEDLPSELKEKLYILTSRNTK